MTPMNTRDIRTISKTIYCINFCSKEVSFLPQKLRSGPSPLCSPFASSSCGFNHVMVSQCLSWPTLTQGFSCNEVKYTQHSHSVATALYAPFNTPTVIQATKILKHICQYDRGMHKIGQPVNHPPFFYWYHLHFMYVLH